MAYSLVENFKESRFDEDLQLGSPFVRLDDSSVLTRAFQNITFSQVSFRWVPVG